MRLDLTIDSMNLIHEPNELNFSSKLSLLYKRVEEGKHAALIVVWKREKNEKTMKKKTQ